MNKDVEDALAALTAIANRGRKAWKELAAELFTIESNPDNYSAEEVEIPEWVSINL